MQIAIMVEGQNGLNWERWQRIANTVEDLGFEGLYRSDHFINPAPPELDSLELWVSLTWLASHTRRISFGPLVSPVSFRQPAVTARMAAAVDDLSHGRLRLGLGAGWQEREHVNYGLELLDPQPRFRRFQEALEVITRLLRGSAPVSFEGEFYRLRDAIVLPRPARAGGPRITIGGNGERRTLPLVVHYADEWNAVNLSPPRFRDLNERLDAMLDAAGRAPSEVVRSLMTRVILGRDEAQLSERLDGRDAVVLREQGMVVGTPGAVEEQLARLAEVGVQRVMLQWLELDELDELELLARHQVRSCATQTAHAACQPV